MNEFTHDIDKSQQPNTTKKEEIVEKNQELEIQGG